MKNNQVFQVKSVDGGHNNNQTPARKQESEDGCCSLKQVLSEYSEKSSVVGVPFIRTARTSTERAIWSLLLLIAIGVTVYHLQSLFTKYFSYEKTTKISLGFNNLTFPAVTFCNVNAVRMSQLQNASESMKSLVKSVSIDSLLAQVKKYEPEFSQMSPDLVGGGDSSSWSNIKIRSSNFFDALPVAIDINSSRSSVKAAYKEGFGDSWQAECEQSTLDYIRDTFTDLFVDISPGQRQQMGHQISDMLLQCSYAGGQCVMSNFSLTQSSLYGNCYTIQYNKWIAKASGPSEGLELILYLESDEYIPGITNEQGIQVVIHEQGTMPFPDDEGIAVAAGSQSVIGLRQVKITRLGNPYGPCTDPAEFLGKYGVKYTRTTCQKICQLNLLRSTCRCYDNTDLPVTTISSLISGIQPCRNETEVICMVAVQEDFQNTNDKCGCNSPCTELQFQKTISSRQWPSSGFADVMIALICKEDPGEGCEILQNNKSAIDQSNEFIKLNIYFEDLNFELLSEAADYELNQFLSDVGGTVGLYIGMSVLGIFELFHLVIEIFSFCICRKGKKVEHY